MTNAEWVLIIGMALVTFGIRYLLLAMASRIELPEWLKESLRFIAPAVLTAITVPAVLMPAGELAISLRNPYLISAIMAAAVGIYSKNVLITIVVGLSGFFIYQVLM